MPFAKTETGEQLELVIDDRPSNVLITGLPGSGKTFLLHSILSKILSRYAHSEVTVWLLDSHGSYEYTEYAAFEAVEVANNDFSWEGVRSFFKKLEAELEKRVDAILKAKVYNYGAYCKSAYGWKNRCRNFWL